MIFTDAPASLESSDLTYPRTERGVGDTNRPLRPAATLPNPPRESKLISQSSMKKPSPPFTPFSNQFIPKASRSSDWIKIHSRKRQRGAIHPKKFKTDDILRSQLTPSLPR